MINAGGLLNVAMELAPDGYNEARVLEKVQRIAHTVGNILATAARAPISTYCAAIRLAEQKLSTARQTKVCSPSGEALHADHRQTSHPQRRVVHAK